MDADDDLTTWAVRVDEPAPQQPRPHFLTPPPPDPEPPRLALVSREVPGRDFQPRLGREFR